MQGSNASTIEATLQKLHEQILDDSAQLPSILRLANLLASKLSNPTLQEWVRQEQNGYHCSLDELPDYRKLRVESYGNFISRYGQRHINVGIPAAFFDSDFLREVATTLVLWNGVTELQNLLSAPDDPLIIRWDNDHIVLLRQELAENEKFNPEMHLVSVWQTLSKSAILQVLDTIRNRLQNFVLELQFSFDVSSLSAPENREEINNVINNFILEPSQITQGGSMSVFNQQGQSVNYQYNAAGNINFATVETQNDVVDQLEQLRSELKRARDIDAVDEERYVKGYFHIGEAIEEAKAKEPDKKSIADHLSAARSFLKDAAALAGLVKSLEVAAQAIQSIF